LKFQLKNSLRFKIAGAFLLASQTLTAHAQTAPAGPSIDISRYTIEGDMPLAADEVQTVLAPFTGPGRTLQNIEEASNALEKAVRDRGYAFHRIFVPVQKPANGEIRLQVIAFKLGKVELTGNEHFSADNIRRSLQGLKEGEPPQVSLIGRDVLASNSNPAKQVSVTFKESTNPASVDAAVKVKDVAPLSAYATLTGNQFVKGNGPETNVYRLTGVVQHANLFDRDHVMTLSYTTDPGHMNNVAVYGAYYQIPLYGTGTTLSAFLTKSDINSGTVQQGAGIFEISGSGRFAGIRATQALARMASFQHNVAISLEDRLFRNSTTFNGVQIQPDVGSRVADLQYAFRSDVSWGDLTGALDYVTNVGGGIHNNEAAHLANGGNRQWNAWRYNLTTSAVKGAWTLGARLKGQYAAKSLVSGEQFGLGGATSVRGFSDRVVSGDNGLQWNLEAVGPDLFGTPFKPAGFIEGGQVHARATNITESIMSVGAGLRMATRNVQLAVDLAQVMDRASTSPTGKPVRLHLSLSYKF
jgi:hemolysin activation/secretion protein